MVVATRNRQASLGRLLRSLARQTLPQIRYEVLVVDNGSTDLTCDLVTQRIGQTPNLRYFFLADPNVSAARNLGANHAWGDWLAFTDDDCLPPDDWLEQAATVIRGQPKAKALGGPIFDFVPPGFDAPAHFRLKSWPESYGRKERPLASNEAFTECNLFIQRQEFMRAGGFDVEIGPGNRRFGFHEGTELQARISRRHPGAPARHYSPRIRMRHAVRPGRTDPWPRMYRAFLSGFDHARAFPKERKHAEVFLAFRAHLATAVAGLALLFGFYPSPAVAERSDRLIFRCGEMWGELWRGKKFFRTHTRSRGSDRTLVQAVADRLLPILKHLLAATGTSNLHRSISLEKLDRRSPLHGLVEGIRLASHPSIYRTSSVTHRPHHPLLSPVPVHRSPPGRRAVFRDARVYGPTPAVVTCSAHLVEEVSRDWGKEGIQLGILRNLALPPLRELPGKTFLAASLGGETYFHWMTDILPMLLSEARHTRGLDAFGFFISHAQSKRFHEETFRRLGIPGAKVLELEKHQGFRCRELVLHSRHHTSGRPPLATLRAVAGFFLPRGNRPSGQPRRRMAVLRAPNVSRPLVHREEILAQLAARGFQEYEPALESIEEQAKAFATAEVIVATHGAALTNLVFCRPGTRVVELFSARYVNPCYAHICQQLGLLHIPVLDQAVKGGVDHGLGNASMPILVTARQVEAALRKARP